MSDIRIAFDPSTNVFDIVLGANGALELDDGLETAVIVSLFTDRRADADEEIPDGSQDRRGWLGDSYADIAGDQIGSRLWLLWREKQTQQTALRAREYALEALQWLIDDDIVRSVDVVAQWIAQGVLSVDIAIVKPAGTEVNFRYQYVWKAIIDAS